MLITIIGKNCCLFFNKNVELPKISDLTVKSAYGYFICEGRGLLKVIEYNYGMGNPILRVLRIVPHVQRDAFSLARILEAYGNTRRIIGVRRVIRVVQRVRNPGNKINKYISGENH